MTCVYVLRRLAASSRAGDTFGSMSLLEGSVDACRLFIDCCLAILFVSSVLELGDATVESLGAASAKSMHSSASYHFWRHQKALLLLNVFGMLGALSERLYAEYYHRMGVIDVGNVQRVGFRS